MKLLITATIIYFPLILIYKLFGYIGDDTTIRHYWVNYYWLVSSAYFMVVFINVSKVCILNQYRLVAFSTAFYWGIMAVLRVYLFFNIDKYKQLTRSADTLTIGCVTILTIFIYLTAKQWFKK
jgi:hypothetical protein